MPVVKQPALWSRCFRGYEFTEGLLLDVLETLLGTAHDCVKCYAEKVALDIKRVAKLGQYLNTRQSAMLVTSIIRLYSRKNAM